jgi:hypothetical protein
MPSASGHAPPTMISSRPVVGGKSFPAQLPARSQEFENSLGSGLLGEGLGAVGRKFEAQGPIACAAA